MTTTVEQILERARRTGQELAPFESSALFSAAIHLAAAQGATLRGQLVQLDESGGISLLPLDERQAKLEPGYLAPEMLDADGPNLKPSEPRVQVYAAGVLGYVLLTGRAPPDPRTGPGAELSGPLGDIVRLALASDRRERFGDLTQLADAAAGVQPRVGAEREHQVFAALYARASKWGQPEVSSELIAQVEKLTARFEEMRARVDRFQSRQAELLERLERYEDGQNAQAAGLRKAPSPWLPTAAAALLASAITLGAAWQLGLLQPSHGTAAPAQVAAAAQGTPSAAASTALSAPPERAPRADPSAGDAKLPPPERAAPARASALEPAQAAQAAAPPPANPASAEPAPPVGAPVAAPPSSAAAAPSPSAAAAPPPSTAATPPSSTAAAPSPKPATTTVAAAAPRPSARPAAEPAAPNAVASPRMVHAVAQSQVNRGEKALELGRIEEALASFHDALDNEAGLAVAYRGLGMAYAMQSNDAMAMQSYQKYLALAPSAGDAEDIRKAIEELKKRAKIGGADDK